MQHATDVIDEHLALQRAVGRELIAVHDAIHEHREAIAQHERLLAPLLAQQEMLHRILDAMPRPEKESRHGLIGIPAKAGA